MSEAKNDLTDLLPCPFCGSPHVELVCSWSAWFVRCNECDANGPTVTDGDDEDVEKAKGAWNTPKLGGRKERRQLGDARKL